MHRLAHLLSAAADGHFPPVDGDVEVLVTDRPGHRALIEFTGHAVVLVDDVDVERVHREIVALGADGYGGVSNPNVALHIAGESGEIGCLDGVMVTRGRGESLAAVGVEERTDVDDHPRVVLSRRHRRDVRVVGDESGFVTLGRGVAGRLEVSIELTSTHGAGHGRRLIDAAIGIAPEGEPLWAQVSPGNAASLRAFLSCGFTPIGSETLIVTA